MRENPQLEIGVLQWDLAMLAALGRGLKPIVLLDRRTPDRLTFTVDRHHPVGGAHHQKIVVIDDCLAFAGGIDITADRWDTSDHLDTHPHRRRPKSRKPTGPWHDVTSLVSGPAARAIGDLARERWESGRGEHLEPVEDVEECWPEGVEPLFTDVDVAISRTRPEHGGASLVHEIELLWLAAIAAAKEFVYIESQYFANRRIAEAMADRLREPDGPEFVVVNPETAQGWLSEKAMGIARAKLLALVREADVHDRFRLYVPVTEDRQPIYVHAKVDGRRRPAAADRLVQPQQPVDGPGHRVRPVDRGGDRHAAAGGDRRDDRRLPRPAARRAPGRARGRGRRRAGRDRLAGAHDRAAAEPDRPVVRGLRAAGPRSDRPHPGRQRAARPGEDAEPLAPRAPVLPRRRGPRRRYRERRARVAGR